MKTISDLNSHWWYRLIKAFVIIILLLINVGVIAFALEDSAPSFDGESSYIQCDIGDKKISFHSQGLYSSYLSSTDEAILRRLCLPKDFGVGPGEHLPLKVTDLDYLGNQNGIPQYSYTPASQNYKVMINNTTRDWGEMILAPFISVIISLIILELVRRIFYYIVLGAFKPKKL